MRKSAILLILTFTLAVNQAVLVNFVKIRRPPRPQPIIEPQPTISIVIELPKYEDNYVPWANYEDETVPWETDFLNSPSGTFLNKVRLY